MKHQIKGIFKYLKIVYNSFRLSMLRQWYGNAETRETMVCFFNSDSNLALSSGINTNFSRIRFFMQVLLKPGVYSEKKYLSMRSQTENMFHAENECDSDNDISHFITQREKCPNTEFFLVRIFPYLDPVNLRIQSRYKKIRTRKNSLFGYYFSQFQLYILL